MRYPLRMGSGPSDDYYELLGIDADADGVQLRRVWRRLALKWHPDRAGPHATATFQKISAAYAVLSNPVARAAYDRGRPAPVRRTSAPPAAPRRRAPGVMLSRLSGPLNALLACGVARRVQGDVIELFLKAQEAAQGGMTTISLRVLIRCPECAGGAPSCRRCGARGAIEELFTAWLAVPPGIADGAILVPTVQLRG